MNSRRALSSGGTPRPTGIGPRRAPPRAWMIVCLCLGLAATSSAPAGSATPGPALDDERILHAVEAEIQVDPAVPEDRINVDVQDGIVTLWGTVDNLLAKERGGLLARTVKGVRAVLNDIEVVPAEAVPSERLRRDVVMALTQDPATEAFQIGVEVRGGLVTLAGQVESWQERKLAETVAKRVKGVRSVRNNLTFVPVPDRADDEIEADVIRRLQTDAWVDESLIGVMVKDGKVSLTGTVGSARESLQAYADAWVAGVIEVDASGLDVKWWARNEMRQDPAKVAPSDETVRRAVEDVLQYDPRVTPFDVEVAVREGIVLLTGVVDNMQAKRAAGRDARGTTGVRGVRNLLKVRPTPAGGPDDPHHRAHDAGEDDHE